MIYVRPTSPIMPLKVARVDLSQPAAPKPPRKRELELLFIDHLVDGAGSHLYEIGISLNELSCKEKPLSSFHAINEAFHILGEVSHHFDSQKEIELTSGEICKYTYLIQAFGGRRPLLEMLNQKEECLSFFLSLIEALRLPKQNALGEAHVSETLPLPDPSPLSFKDLLISADIRKIASPKIQQESIERTTKKIAVKKNNRMFRIHI